MSARLVALLPLAALALAIPAASVQGQAVTDTSAGSAAVSLVVSPEAGPTLQSLTVGARLQSTPIDARDLAALQQRAGLGQAQALMIVGGGAILVGAIIGDDPGTVLMVGGAVIGLYGLYKYLQ